MEINGNLNHDELIAYFSKHIGREQDPFLSRKPRSFSIVTISILQLIEH